MGSALDGDPQSQGLRTLVSQRRRGDTSSGPLMSSWFLPGCESVGMWGWVEGEATAKYFGCQGPGEDAGILQEIGTAFMHLLARDSSPPPTPPRPWEETCVPRRDLIQGQATEPLPALPCARGMGSLSFHSVFLG